MSLEEKIRVYNALREKIETLEEAKRMVGLEILQLMPKDAKALRAGDHVIKRYARLSIKLSLDEARNWGALKMQEVIDRKKIKELIDDGQVIPGVTESHYIQVTSAHTSPKLSETYNSTE